MKEHLICPHCGRAVLRYRNPIPTVDIIIEMDLQHPPGVTGRRVPSIVLVRRKNPPHGWALPGGFVDYGESLEAAARREAKEETSLDVELLYQLGAYSDPSRDPRYHTISVVFVARAGGHPRAGDDATDIAVVDQDSLPGPLAFDHEQILNDYFLKWHSDA